MTYEMEISNISEKAIDTGNLTLFSLSFYPIYLIYWLHDKEIRVCGERGDT